EWAIATRVQADRDVIIVPDARSKPLDPSLPPPVEGKVPTTAKMGIDATISENVARNRYNRIAYFNQGKIRLNDYLVPVGESAKPSGNGKSPETLEAMAEKISAALGKSHHFFADLLAIFPKAEYRVVASALGKLHQEGKIVQDGDGKYQLK